jgi:pimeloyl-ACP methyl ester carboxylesterase
LLTRTGDVIMASSDAASAAVHAAGDGRARAVVLLAPRLGEVFPDIEVDLGPRMAKAFEIMDLAAYAKAVEDPEQRRSALADGMIRMFGPELPDADADRLRSMIRDYADLMLDPEWHRASPPAPYAETLSALDAPVLVVAAGGDPLAAAFERALAERAPHGELALLDTALSPYPWLAQPDAAADAVLQFLALI